MRILVHGAGAVGGYFGARLAIGGHDVIFVARGENLAALRRQGLTLRLSTGEALRVVPAHAVGDPAEAPPPELVLVTVKSYDTPAAAAALRPAVGPETAILSLQNGIENEDVLARVLGLPPLMVGLTRIGVELVEPATVAYSGRGTILFGQPDGRETPRARRVARGLPCTATPSELRAAPAGARIQMRSVGRQEVVELVRRGDLDVGERVGPRVTRQYPLPRATARHAPAASFPPR